MFVKEDRDVLTSFVYHHQRRQGGRLLFLVLLVQVLLEAVVQNFQDVDENFGHGDLEKV